MGQLNFKISNNYFALFLISFLSIVAHSNEAINNNDNISKSLTITNQVDKSYQFNRNTYDKDPLAFYSIDLTRVLNKDLKVIEISNLLVGEKRFLSEGEFFKVTGKDNNEYLSDSSFLVQFKILPDFNSFAFDNNLYFLANLSDINIGIFKPQDISNIEIILNKLKQDNNIQSLSLNLYHSKSKQ